MNSDIIEVKDFTIIGTRHPKVFIKGIINNKDATLVLKVDGKEINYHNLSLDKSFNISSNLPSDTKKIELNYKINNKEYLVLGKSTNIAKRLISFILRKIKRVLDIIIRVILNIFRGIRYFFKEYHLLVPTSKWGKYFKDFKTSVTIDKSLYDPQNQYDYNKWIKTRE